MRHALGILLLAVCAVPGHANDIFVTANGTGDGSDWDHPLPTVTAGLQKAQGGDTVYVWVGFYPERITLKPGVTLRGGYFFGGVRLPLLCILDGGAGGSVVTVPAGVGPSTNMEGFVIQNGSGTPIGGKARGGGIFMQNASPTLRYLFVNNNRADIGAGLYLSNSGADIALSHFTRNEAKEAGGGVAIEGGTPMLYICTFRGNAAPVGGGVHAAGVNTLLLAENVFEANHASQNGSAAYLDKGAFWNNTVLRNTGTAPGAVALAPSGGASFVNNIIAYNSSGLAIGQNTTKDIRNNDVFENAAGNYTGVADRTGTDGNISKAPALMDPYVGDYTPAPGSPCVDAGDDSAVQPGWNDYYMNPRIAGVCVDIGAAEWPQAAPTTDVIHVKPGGNDTTIGIDWEHAMGTLQAAVNAGIKYGLEVWVAAGTYNGFTIQNKNVKVFGGFAGTETKRNQRDPAMNVTVLEGDLYSSVVMISGGLGSADKVDANTVIDGFTIRGGYGYMYSATERLGGGILCLTASPIISGNIIEKNDAGFGYGKGGGIYLDNSSAIVSRNTIRDNDSDSGGGLYATYGSPVIRNNTISGNEAGFGAGIMTEHAYPTVTGNVILGNVAQTSGGGVSSVFGKIILRGNRIADNTSYGAGGGARLDEAEITWNVFSGNAAPQGAAALDQLAKAVIANNLIIRNKTTGYVGGLAAAHVEATISNNTVAYNEGRGVHLVPGAQDQSLKNNIIAGNATGLLAAVQSTGILTASNNCVYGNTKDYDTIAPIATDIHADPRFVDAGADNFRLRFDSPCIDAGDDAARVGEADLDGQYRLQGAHVDIGAYEAGLGAPVGLEGALAALRIAGGLEGSSPAAMATLDVETTGPSQGHIDVGDACRLLRQAAGLD